MSQNIQGTYTVVPTVFSGNVITIPLKDLPRIINKIGENAKKVSKNIALDLSNQHLETSRNIIQNSSKRDNAKRALLTHVSYLQTSKFKSIIISDSEVGAFFESGVAMHEVYHDMTSVYGYKVSEWMDKHGLGKVSSFIVGKPGTALAKGTALHFMERGFDTSWNNAGDTADRWLRAI